MIQTPQDSHKVQKMPTNSTRYLSKQVGEPNYQTLAHDPHKQQQNKMLSGPMPTAKPCSVADSQGAPAAPGSLVAPCGRASWNIWKSPVNPWEIVKGWLGLDSDQFPVSSLPSCQAPGTNSPLSLSSSRRLNKTIAAACAPSRKQQNNS